MEFYEYVQNNSGGKFTVNKFLCHRVIIEADEKLEALGGYFDGEGDCPCCGDRWYRAHRSLQFPMEIAGFPGDTAELLAKMYKAKIKRLGTKKAFADLNFCVVLPDLKSYILYALDKYAWTDPDTRVYYANGKVKEFRSAAVKKALKIAKKRKTK